MKAIKKNAKRFHASGWCGSSAAASAPSKTTRSSGARPAALVLAAALVCAASAQSPAQQAAPPPAGSPPAAPQAAAPAPAPAAPPKGDPERGEQKNRMCTGCHGIRDYRTAYPVVYSVPLIAGQNEGYLANALKEYRARERSHPSMRAIAASLSDQDIADLAAYYSGVKPN